MYTERSRGGTVSRKMWIPMLFICAAVGAEGQTISTIAGSKYSFPTAPVPAVQAPLGKVSAAAVDKAGNYYVADPDNNLVLKVNASGTLTVVAGNGSIDYFGDGGPATSAGLSNPHGVAVDGGGNLFIPDTGHQVIRKVNTAGIITTVAGNGTEGYSGDGGPATSAELRAPYGVAVDNAGNLFIADLGNNRIRMVTAAGTITTVAGNGTNGYSGDGGPATSAELSIPWGVAVDGAGNLFIADWGNQRIRKVNTAGTITTVAGNSAQGYSGDGGPATSAELSLPSGVAVDGAGNLFIADTNNQRIRMVNTAGTVTTVAGTGTAGYSGDGGPASGASLNDPQGVAVDSAGNLFIADYENERVRRVALNGIITTVAGDGGYRYAGDGGPATSALLDEPAAVAVDNAGNLFIADTENGRIRKVNPGGTITTVAGSGINSYSGDGGPATSAELFYPFGVAVDNASNLFIAETYNNRIRMVDPAGTITTVAGTGKLGYGGDGGPATSALLSGPEGLALDGAGNLFIADANNSVIRKVNPAGTITTVAGNGRGSYSGDGGPATSAQLSGPLGVAVDNTGDILIADTLNNRIRKVNAAGTITTVAGNGASGYSGDGGPATSAELSFPAGVAVDNAGNFFIADENNDRVRMVNAAGIITTVAGGGPGGVYGDGGPATSAWLNYPEGVAVDNAGDLLIADTYNNRIREVPRVLAAPATTVSAASGTAPVAPGSIVSIYGSNLATT
jgi:sugar lactone lactonase YvrE